VAREITEHQRNWQALAAISVMAVLLLIMAVVEVMPQ
jgi:hypothetical protein